MANNKKIIWIGIASALLIGGGIFWWWRTQNPKNDNSNLDKEPDVDKSPSEEAVINNQPTSTGLPATPFKNNVEGNAFRVWMSNTHPDFRYKGDVLDRSGSYDNSFMRVAYSKYGSEYASKTNAKASAPSGYKSGSLIYLKVGRSNTSIYSFPEFKGDYIIGNVAKTDILDKPFAKYISNTGKGFLKVETIGYTPKCPPNARCISTIQPMKKIVYVPEAFVSHKPF